MCALWNPLKLYVHAVVGVGATGPQIVLKPNPREAAPYAKIAVSFTNGMRTLHS